MRTIILVAVLLFSIGGIMAQEKPLEFGTCFSKGNTKSIINKMDNFKSRVSEETGCEKDEITFEVNELYTVFYTKECRHLPKRITFNACGEKRVYKHNGLSGAILYWLLGSWTLVKD